MKVLVRPWEGLGKVHGLVLRELLARFWQGLRKVLVRYRYRQALSTFLVRSREVLARS